MGEISKEITTVWIACHGYAQLAGEFIRELEPLAGHNVLIVAPEALSRFYTKGFFGKVGATWMTKEDRLAEIDDNVAYLQSLYERIKLQVNSQADIHVLGFSQGCSTICRWITRKVPALQSLWLCSGSIPDDLDFEGFRLAIQNYPVRLIIGDDDPFISGKDNSVIFDRVKAHKLPLKIQVFKGGHDLNLSLVKSLM